MKRITTFFAAIVAFTINIQAQVAKADFDKAEVVWYGLDFTQAKMVGSAGFTQPEVIRNDYFEKWNSLVLVEADKYNIKGALQKSDMKYDVEMIKPLNSNVDYTKLVQDKTHTLTKEDVEKAVKRYKTDQTSGYGVVFVVESFDKIQEKGFVWATIFDAKTKKVLVTEKLEAAPGGFGLRNYWASVIAKVIITIKNVKYKSWIKA